MVSGLLYNHDPNFGYLSRFLSCQEHPCPISPDLGLWRIMEVPDWGLGFLSLFGYGHWSLIHPWSEFWISILIFKVQRTSKSFKSSFGALEDTGGSWLVFGIYIFIWTCSGTLFGSLLKFRSHSDQLLSWKRAIFGSKSPLGWYQNRGWKSLALISLNQH